MITHLESRSKIDTISHPRMKAGSTLTITKFEEGESLIWNPNNMDNGIGEGREEITKHHVGSLEATENKESRITNDRILKLYEERENGQFTKEIKWNEPVEEG